MERYLNKPQADEPPINADPLNARHPRQHFRLLAFTKRALDFGIAALRRGDIDTSSPEGYTFYRHQATGITVLVVVSYLFSSFMLCISYVMLCIPLCIPKLLPYFFCYY